MKAKTHWKNKNNYGSKLKALSYDEKYMKIRFDSDDDFPLKKLLERRDVVIVITYVFYDNDKYYLQVFWTSVYTSKLSRCRGCSIMELTSLKG